MKQRLFNLRFNRTDAYGDHTCKNCHREFTGRYCPDCGQSVKELQKPFGFVIYDFIGTVSAFDTRLLKTLKLLIFYPGKLGTEFLEGKRARYVPPFRLLFFVSFLFFLLLNHITSRGLSTIKDATKGDIEKELVKLQLSDDSLSTEQEEITVLFADSIVSDSTSSVKRQQPLLDKLGDSLKEKSYEAENPDEKLLLSQASKLASEPEFYLSFFLRNFSWAMFLLIPLYALFLKLFFWKSKSFYISHLVFSVHFHSFFYALGAFAIALSLITGDKIDSLIWTSFFMIIPIHLFISFYKYYRKPLGATLKRFLAINFLHFMSLFTSLIVVFILSLKYF